MDSVCADIFCHQFFPCVPEIKKISFGLTTPVYNNKALSQAPRKYNTEPMQNLSQLFPYPEKPEELSRSTSEAQQHIPIVDSSPRLQRDDARASEHVCLNSRSEDVDASGVITTDQQANLGPNPEIDFNCFDVNLDTISSQEAAFLAETMMSMMSSVTLGDEIREAPPSLPGLKTAPIRAKSKPRRDSISQYSDFSKVKLEDQDDTDLPTLLPDTHLSLVVPKLEPTSTTLAIEETDIHDCSPTQEPPSKETNVILCGTFMNPTKKVCNIGDSFRKAMCYNP